MCQNDACMVVRAGLRRWTQVPLCIQHSWVRIPHHTKIILKFNLSLKGKGYHFQFV